MTDGKHEVLIIGGGIAGLALALEVADHRRVTLLRPESDDQGASRWAQGGIAAVLSPQDDIEAHVADTLVAGDGLCDPQAVRFTVEQGPSTIEWLLTLGVPFTPDASADAGYPYHLTREGGHGARRIIHADDATGRAVVETLRQHVEAHPNIRLHGELTAIGLIGDNEGHCRGARCLDAAGRLHELTAEDTVLATGGASGLYRHTTSPQPASGEGMMMAAELGAELMNLEFQQFHPTCLYDPQGPAFLISEAVRGEGGLLIDAAGERFMPAVDPRAELAPRDIVARAIDAQMQRTGSDHVYLDIRHLGEAAIRLHFPTIHAHCASRGLDIVHQPIPVVPAAHYSCGGITTDLAGATTVPRLHAIGEAACTGLHGANRMASNSLLECLVYARSCGRRLRTAQAEPNATPLPMPRGEQRVALERIEQIREAMRQLMSTRVAIVRTDQGLEEAACGLETLYHRLAPQMKDVIPSVPLTNLWHALRLARLTVACARARRESRGLHYNPDCPTHGDAFPQPSRITLRALEDLEEGT
ncbi:MULTISPECIES: L-aspartate oxidase [Halomonas]|uniref:L-aspartate oxidase n=1 Tax=Halomonas ventosae TaxID=229007 RepID=A0A4R6GNX5_9GAMM|nr:L-aspartate oxidase [Halomonas ventosae]TDN96164.1 L-aspartate oxidase [Halomonas ventosae]